MEHVNKVVLIGNILKQTKLNEVYKMELRVRRPSGKYDFLKILISETLLKKTGKILGKRVEIKGFLGIYQEEVCVIAQELKIVTADEDMNLVKMIGLVKSVRERTTFKSGTKIADISLSVCTDGQVIIVPCIAWWRRATYVSQNAETDQIIAIKGRLQSRNFAGKQYYEISLAHVHLR